MRVKNESDAPVRLAADARLLTLAVTAPGAKKPALCALPRDSWPLSDRERELVLPPERSWSRSFDPRFFCFAAKEAAALVPGASVVATLGFDEPRPARGRKGRPAQHPFVATMLPEAAPAPVGIKRLAAAAFTIAEAPELTAKSAGPKAGDTAPPSERKPESDSLVELTVGARIDAAIGREVAATVSLRNRDHAPVTTLFRPSTVGFEVLGPEGVVHCTQRIVRGSPIAELFSTLAAGASSSLTVNVDAACPNETFARAGVYEVSAIFDSTGASGTALGLRTLDASVRGREPLLVRVRRSAPGAPEPAPKLDP